MKLNRQELLNKSASEIKMLVEQHGSVFVTYLGINTILVQHIFVADEKLQSLEYSPSEQFEEILPNIWWREYTLPKVKNLCYWLYKNCLQYADEEKYEEKRNSLIVQDKYCKNTLPFFDSKGNEYFKQTYILPIASCKNKVNLVSNKISFFSKTLQEDRELIIEYTKSVNVNKPYKFLIVADGEVWKYSLNLGNWLGQISKDKNLIICYIVQKDRNQELPLNKKFCKFVSHDIVNYLTDKFAATYNPDNFIFWGQSFGGLAAIGLDMYCPNRIGTIICQSASLWWDKEQKIINFYSKHKPNCRFYYSYGVCENNFITNDGARFKSFLAPVKQCRFNIFAGGHDYISWLNDLMFAMKNFVI